MRMFGLYNQYLHVRWGTRVPAIKHFDPECVLFGCACVFSFLCMCVARPCSLIRCAPARRALQMMFARTHSTQFFFFLHATPAPFCVRVRACVFLFIPIRSARIDDFEVGFPFYWRAY